MSVAHALLLLMGMLLLAMVLEPLARRLRLPFAGALVAAGYLGATALVAAGIDTGLRWHHFHDLIFYVLLPVLIFEAAFRMEARRLLRALPAVLILAIPLLVFSAAVTGAILYWTINHPLGFPWLAALLTGALLSATDPGAVMSLLHRLGVPDDLILLLEGESLFNDATAIVLFSLLLGMATMEPQSPGPLEASLEFGRLFLGGLAMGLAVGLIAALLLQGFRQPPYPSIITLMAAYVSYLLAEFALGVSGVMSSLACGLVAGARHRALGSAGQEAVESIWQLLAWIANSTMFLLAGATVTLAMFQHRWLAMLLAIAAVLVTRWLSVLAASWLIRPVPGTGHLDRQARELLIWGGLRGAVTLALALSLPVELEYWWTIQSIAYGVVLFTLFVQAPTLPLVVRRLPS